MDSNAMTPPANPKKIYGDTKIPFQLLPTLAEIEWAKAHSDGANKYGAYNWRENKVEAMTYVGAIRRHLMAWLCGETIAKDSGIHHLGHVMACCAILIDAEACDQLIDDRPKETGQRSLDLMEEYRLSVTKNPDQNMAERIREATADIVGKGIPT
ncbi:MAG: dATP/dGTP diphosphohydrolase domain-containing protein [Geminicoccaceae bacterium]